jgi:carboxypeptidase C (cathepsin A)
MSAEQARLLPSGVFECSTPGLDHHKEFVWTVEEPGREKKRTVTVSVRAGQVGTSDADHLQGQVDEQQSDFCDGSSKSISGYMDLKGSDYDKNGEDKHLFFWMFEKRQSESTLHEQDRAAIPFVVWLTGGPGCSSTLALLTENGPCTVNPDGKTTAVNPHSWTEAAHVLWLDQPAGVGFSYGDADDSNEQMVAEDAYWFLQAFFKTYPEYHANPLYIIGESYAGALFSFV